MKKRLLFIINTLGLAGAEVALLGMLSAIPKDEYEIDLMVLMNQGELIERIPDSVNLLCDRSKYVTAPIHSKEGAAAMTKKALSSLFKNRHVFKNFGYIISNACTMLLSGSGLKKDKLLWKVISDATVDIDTEYDAAIAYIEGGSTYYLADHVKAKRKIAFVHISYELTGYNKKLDHGCYEAIDKIYCVSDEVKKSFLNYYPDYANKTEVFHNIIDAEGVKNRALDLSEIQQCDEWNSYKGFKLVTVGRLNHQKGYDMAVQALDIISRAGVDLKWYAVGDGEQNEMLMNLAKSLGVEDCFVILGRKANPYPYMAGADIYVQPSRFEGKSIAIEEAKILCCPMVITRCDGNMEQLTDGVDGLYCDMTPESIADEIIRLYKDADLRAVFRDSLAKEDRSKNLELDAFLAFIS